MITAKNGWLIPESHADFDKLDRAGLLRYRGCNRCGEKFGPTCVRTGLAWMDTQVSGFCENCLERLYAVCKLVGPLGSKHPDRG